MITQAQKKKILDLLSIVDYERAILFGSHARGDANPLSDFDLLLVLSDSVSMQEKMKLSGLLRRRFASNLIDADIIIKDREDIAYLEDKPGSIVRNALREGVVL